MPESFSVRKLEVPRDHRNGCTLTPVSSATPHNPGLVSDQDYRVLIRAGVCQPRVRLSEEYSGESIKLWGRRRTTHPAPNLAEGCPGRHWEQVLGKRQAHCKGITPRTPSIGMGTDSIEPCHSR